MVFTSGVIAVYFLIIAAKKVIFQLVFKGFSLVQFLNFARDFIPECWGIDKEVVFCSMDRLHKVLRV